MLPDSGPRKSGTVPPCALAAPTPGRFPEQQVSVLAPVYEHRAAHGSDRHQRLPVRGADRAAVLPHHAAWIVDTERAGRERRAGSALSVEAADVVIRAFLEPGEDGRINLGAVRLRCPFERNGARTHEVLHEPRR